jgi:imidazolonepropionase-like amidohydrolase
MLRTRLFLLFGLSVLLPPSLTAQSPQLSTEVQEFVRVRGPRIVLTHVRVIDGTGAPAQEDQNVVVEGAKIASTEPGANVAMTDGTSVLDLHGYSLMPGIVGTHNHLFYIARPNLNSDRKCEEPLLVNYD